ncbi:MAG: hypothetical protein ABI471_06865 [Sphingomonas bacterium]
MFIGHYGPAFLAATSRRAPKLGTLFIAAQLVDLGFFGLMLAGVEHMRLVPGITRMNPMDLYDMPWTHSLVGALGWSAGFALLLWLWQKRTSVALIGGAVVFSHWLLDLLVHRPDLTLAGAQPAYGFGLWNLPVIEMPLEAAFAFGGLVLFATRTRPTGSAGRWPIILLALTMIAFEDIDWFLPKPATVTAAIPLSALFAYIVMAALAWWVSRTQELKA